MSPFAVMSKPADDKSEKEARLAAALRVNLRRRKAAKRPAAPEKQSNSEKS